MLRCQYMQVSRPHRPEDDPESPGAPQARLLSRQHSSGATAPQTVLMDAMDAVAGHSAAPPEPLLATDSPIYHKKGLEGNMHGPHDADDDEEMQDGTRIRAGRPETFWQKLGKVLYTRSTVCVRLWC